MGLPWIKLDVDCPDHPKVQALALELGIPRAQAFGHLCVLWTSVGRLAPSGEITGPHADEVVEQMAGWTGESTRFSCAMVACRLLDPIADGYEVHDWEEHAGAFVERYRRDAKRKREERAARAKPRTSSTRPQDVPRTSAGRPANVPIEREREIEKKIKEEACGEVNSPPPSAGTHVAESIAHPLPASPTVAVPPKTVLATLPCVGAGPDTFEVTEAHIAEWQKAFPGVDVLGEVLRAKVWLDANPARRKTHRGAPAFLVRWLGKTQDRGLPLGASPPRPPPTPQEPCAKCRRRRTRDDGVVWSKPLCLPCQKDWTAASKANTHIEIRARFERWFDGSPEARA
jgi:hypothetical protein